MDTEKIVKAGQDRMAFEFSERIAEVGFKRYKKWFWTRLNEKNADFIHLHQQGSSYGGPINNSVSLRVNIGTRELNDGSEPLHLNGPCSEDSIYISDSYHLRFNAKSGNTFERCLDD